ncbi:MAG: response regulator [Planctomycetes bacterium]|nr:response regulator [Planctomycetota bacterium]
MDPETYRYFRVEAGDLHKRLSSGVLKLEQAADAKLTGQLLRNAHTLKGAASVVKASIIAECTHAIEGALIPFRETGLVPPQAIGMVLRELDAIEREFRELDTAMEGPAATVDAENDGRLRIVRSDAGDIDRIIDGVTEASLGVTGVARQAADFQHMRRLHELLSRQLAPMALRQRGEESASWNLVQSLLDEVKSLATRIDRTVVERSESAEIVLRQVREDAEQLRLVSTDILFGPLERAVRDGSLAAGSTVGFRSSGGDVCVDARVLEVMQAALLQLVRNALAHGIERPDERIRAGKNPEGIISIDVERSGSDIVFRCADDGRGIDREGVRRRAGPALRSGQVPASPSMDDGELLDLLLGSGISTASTVTQQSGRGVGMDIVRDACSELGGRSSLRTSTKGTTFLLTVPVSLSSIEALVVIVAGSTLAFPLSAVSGMLRIPRAEIVGSEGGETILHAGRSLPLYRLNRTFSQSGDAGVPEDTGGSISAVVLTSRIGTMAYAVEQVLGGSRIILRPVPRLAPVASFITGVAIDADGRLQYALDPSLLAESVGASSGAKPDPGIAALRNPVLIIDDSLTTRMLEQSILRSAGYLVETASSAEEGMEKAKGRVFALFLVDVEMPGMGGLEFVRKVRADPSLSHIPAILVTSCGEAADRTRGFEAGAKAYIVKGEFDQRALLRHIHDLIGF